MSEHNWTLFKNKREERVILVSSEDMENMLDWYYRLTRKNPFLKDQFTFAKSFIEDSTPITEGKFEIVTTVKNLEQIKKMFSILDDKTEKDKNVFKIVEEALNPKNPEVKS